MTDIIVKSIDLVAKIYTDKEGNVNPIQPLSAYIAPKRNGTTEHDRYVTDEAGVVSKQGGSGSSGEVISQPIGLWIRPVTFRPYFLNTAEMVAVEGFTFNMNLELGSNVLVYSLLSDSDLDVSIGQGMDRLRGIDLKSADESNLTFPIQMRIQTTVSENDTLAIAFEATVVGNFTLPYIITDLQTGKDVNLVINFNIS